MKGTVETVFPSVSISAMCRPATHTAARPLSNNGEAQSNVGGIAQSPCVSMYPNFPDESWAQASPPRNAYSRLYCAAINSLPEMSAAPHRRFCRTGINPFS